MSDLWRKCLWQGSQSQAYREVFTASSGTDCPCKVSRYNCRKMNQVNDHQNIEFRRYRADADDEQQMRNRLFRNAFLGQPFNAIYSCKQLQRFVADGVKTDFSLI